ncbi:MAG: hypothetical protein LBP92_09635 [Deltaproteobacteria bacterium]|jgi:hypothetical protein|nr:hypothetical protein [Deltaproteobacteria bacterium]
MRHLKTIPVIVLLAVAMVSMSCAPRYEFKPIPIRSMDGYANKAQFPEGRVGAHALYDSKEAARFFGFDVTRAGVIPVQLAVENDQPEASLVLSRATMQDDEGLLWEVLPSDVVHRRIDEHTSGGLTGEQGVRRSLLWGLAGGILGAAVGVVTGTSVATGAAKGAAAGAAIGIVSSIGQSGMDSDTDAQIQRDFSTRDIDHATVAAGQTGNGLLYFPSEAGKPSKLNLTFKTGAGQRDIEIPL